ncbi:MAG: aminotransferase class I/II-fold pyridoxal phosphate-dependent enzyme [Jatrophihabitantaceae bacterium]
MLSLSDDDFRYFVERAVRGMCAIVADLGDDAANARVDVPGANSAYALVTHCLGVMSYWGGEVNRGRDAHRDRDAEFASSGPVAELLARADAALVQFGADVAAARSDDPPPRPPAGWARGPHRELTQAGVLMHVYEEVAQHHGQLEVLRDALRAGPPAFEPPMHWLRAKRGVKWARPGPDLIPAWVADMDFPIAPPIRGAITGMLDRGDLGYPDWSQNPLAAAFARRMQHSFGWAPDPSLVRPIADLIQSLQVILHLATEPGDAVVTLLPSYPPFPASIATMQRRLNPVRLRPDGESWTWDEDDLDHAAAGATVLLLVNPHNPTGRVFTTAELQHLADVAERHDLLVISDEIHAELVFGPHEHVPFATIAPGRTVTVTSATKAYNIAGVRTAVAHVGPDRLRERWDAMPPDLFGLPSTLGVEATVAAWRDCDSWLDRLRAHLRAQRDHLVDRVDALPGVRMRVPDAGYLAWLDCTDAALGRDPAAFFREHAGLELAPGPDYDPAAEGWVRLNFATGRGVLDEILDRMQAALGSRE